MPGLDRILRGILHYRAHMRPGLIKQFEIIRDNPHPNAVMFSCMDSRILLTRLLSSDVGDMFLVRNAGNLIPHHDYQSFDAVTTEPAALELGCIINNIRHVMVCGHSDCKAMNALFSIKNQVREHEGSPLELWLKKHGSRSVEKFDLLKKTDGTGTIKFQAERPDKHFDAYIDPERNFSPVDRFSQINTLQQIQNICSQPILTEKLLKNEVRLHALWFDVYSGEFLLFSREQKRFLMVTDDTYQHLLDDGESLVR